MAPDLGRRLMPSLMDRLTDPDSAGYGVAVGYSETQMREAVKRDLVDLLNAKLADPTLTRECPDMPRPGEPRAAKCYGTGLRTGAVCGTCCPELKSSVLAYGLPDLTTYDATDKSQCEEIARAVEQVIARHEPRLANVRVVVPKQPLDPMTRELRFQVEATLAADPANQLSFTTVLELVSGQATIDPPSRKPA